MNIDWKNLGFALMPTAGSIRLDYNGESWSEPEVMREEHISLHIGAQALHYGQACFEGLKAFFLKDGGVGLFRPEMNARRMLHSAERICMVAPPEELFVEACLRAVELNREYVPPYGTGASLYLRPLLIGTEPMLPVMPSSTFTFLLMVSPVGPYYKEGFTPDSPSILPSITNNSLRQLAKDMGLTVLQQPIPVADLEQFVEVGACGTAAIITPIASVTHGKKTVRFGQGEAGPILTRLYQELQSIQYGEVEDRHGWVTRL